MREIVAYRTTKVFVQRCGVNQINKTLKPSRRFSKTRRSTAIDRNAAKGKRRRV